jgi:amino acid transporter
MDITTLVGLFNVVVGLMLTASILAMCGGLMLWYIRWGPSPSYRDDAIDIMQWGVAILFVLVVLLYVAQFVQENQALVTMVAVVFIVALVAYFIAKEALSSGKVEKKKE